MCPRSITFQHLMDWVLIRVMRQSHCGGFVGNIKATDLDITDNTVVFAESQVFVMMALGALIKRVATGS